MNGRVMTGRQRMLGALTLQPVDRPPVWFMRQAGRHLPGYRRVREMYSFLDVCCDERINVEVSAEPWHRYGVDGAIVFNDILTPLRDMGMGLDFVPGPRFDRLIETATEARDLAQPEYGPETDVARCIGLLRRRVEEQAAVLGFVGAPFTVAAFAIAGSGAQRRAPMGELVRKEPELFVAMQEVLLPVLADYARVQVEAGADVIQVFESLAEELEQDEYRRLALPFLTQLIQAIASRVPDVPIIAFGRGMWPYIGDLAKSPAQALSVDHTDELSRARTALRNSGSKQALQGNLSPEVLRQGPLVAGAAAGALLRQWREIVPLPEQIESHGPTGWVFNLGHGVPADADPAAVEAVIAVLQAFDFANAGEPEGVIL